MIQAEIDRAVARATGETVSTIKRLGFLLDEPHPGRENSDLADLKLHVVRSDEPQVRRSQPFCRMPSHVLALP